MPSGRLTLDWVGKDQALLTTPEGVRSGWTALTSE